MKFGNYDLGTPIEAGITGDKNFYYPLHHGAPLLSSQQGTYDPSLAEYKMNCHTIGSHQYLRGTDMYDYKQQFISPGTAYGYGKKIDTDNAPYKNLSETLSTNMTDSMIELFTHMDWSSIQFNGLFGAQFPRMGGIENLNRNIFSGVTTRYNPVYQSSLFTELVKHNIKTAETEGIFIGDTFGAGANPIESLTKLLFAGTFSTDNPSSPFGVDTQNFKFVDSGMPYVKFRIQSNVVDENGIPVGTSDNDVGYIDYYMMLRVTNHFDANTTDPFTPAGEFGESQNDEMQQILDSYFDLTQFNKNTIPSYRFEMNQNVSLIPTIIADFRNPTYSVSIDDANIDIPNPQGYEGKLEFPFPGQFNPHNDPNKAPNFGTHYYQSGASGNIAAVLADYAEMEASFLSIGVHPMFFTFDNLYMQDYDILGEFGDNPSFSFMQMKFYDMSWVQNTYLALMEIIIELDSEQYSPDDENVIKAKVMFNRLLKWHSVLTQTTGTDGQGMFTTFYNHRLVGQGNTWQHLNITPPNDMQTDEFMESFYAYNDELSTENYLNVFDSHNSGTGMHQGINAPLPIYKLADPFSPPGLRMFGPPAPIGYVPRCGVNYRNYFGLDASYETGEPPTLGNTNFVFNNGLDVGSIVSLDNALGHDSSQLTGEIENYSGNIDVLASKLFDRELWKLFYDVQLMIDRDYPGTPLGWWGFIAPTNYIQYYHSGNPQTFRDTLTQEEKKKFNFCYNFNLYTDGLDAIYNGALPHYTYQTITAIFTGQFIGNAGVNTLVSTGGINPYIDESYNLLEQSNHRSRIRSLLIQTPPAAGGIQNFEIDLWVDWLKGGCTQNYPTPHISPAVTSPSSDVFGVNQYGAFVGSAEQIIVPIAPTNYIDVDVNTSIPFTTNNWWQICNYLNQFEELKNGSISFISEIPIEDSSEDYGSLNTTQNVILFSSNYVTGDNESIAAFYPANSSVGVPAGFFTQGSKIRVHFGSNYAYASSGGNVTPIYTEAFGPPPTSVGYESGTTFLQMINELVLNGIEGQQIDCYPYAEDGNSGDGIYDLQDGYEWLRITTDLGTPDYRPLQLIGYALENNLMDTLTYFLPPSSSPSVSGDTIDYDAVLAPQPNKFPLPPIAVGAFDGVNSAVRIDNENIFYSSEKFVGAVSDGPGTLGMQESALWDNGYQDRGHEDIRGREITTGSRNISNHPYFFPVVVNFDDLNEFSSEEMFDVSWGHINGEGSLKKHNGGHSPSEAIYRQAANELLGNPSGSFYSVSQSIKNHLDLSSEPAYMSETPEPDEYVWILKMKQNKFSTLGELHSQLQIHLSGSNAAGAGASKVLFAGAKASFGGNINDSSVVQNNGLRRFYISTAYHNNIQTDGVYGYWYPEIGTAVINSKIGETITGGAGTTVTNFNKVGEAHNGMKPSGLTRTDKEYNNSLKLVNCMKNMDTNFAIKRLFYKSLDDRKLNILACIRLRGNEFNFTTNHTRFANLNPEEGFDTFNDTMKFNEVSRTSPTTYITHVDLYDVEGYRVATAKLSKPIKKDFNSEVVIKIMISDI